MDVNMLWLKEYWTHLQRETEAGEESASAPTANGFGLEILSGPLWLVTFSSTLEYTVIQFALMLHVYALYN